MKTFNVWRISTSAHCVNQNYTKNSLKAFKLNNNILMKTTLKAKFQN